MSRVLVVDDEEPIRRVLRGYLEADGHTVTEAADGQAALDAMRRDAPDLVLLDVMMPRMSGFQACARIKGNPATRDIPVLMVTALNEVGDVERAVECGADDFLTKPVNRLELLTRVRSQLKIRIVKRQLERTMAELRRLKREG